MTDSMPDDEFTHDIRRAYARTPGPRPGALDAVIAAAVAETQRTTMEQKRMDDPIPLRGRIPRRQMGMVAVVLSLAAALVIAVSWRRSSDTNTARAYATEHPSAVSTGGRPNVLSKNSVDSNKELKPSIDHNYANNETFTQKTPESPNSPSQSIPQDPTTASATTSSPSINPTLPLTVPSSPSIPPHPSDDATNGLDPESAVAVARILDSAAARGLPIPALVSRVREGVRRGVPGPRIVVVTRNYATALTEARTALGPSTVVAELQSGAEALLAGIPLSALQQFRAARPTGSLSEPLVALTDLTAHGVAARQATAALASLLAHGSSDIPIRALRTDVISDIVRGASPEAALAGRLRQAGNDHPRDGRTPFNGTPDSTPLRRGTP